MTARDLLLAQRAKRHGAKSSLRIVYEARKAGIPISLAFALVQQESGFRNVFGHDSGGPFKGEPVTHEKVKALLNHVAAGGVSNGVGLTQLTWPGYIKEAEHLGGAHIPKNQLRVGFNALARNIHAHGEVGGLATYNAGDPHNRKGIFYARQVEEKQSYWHRVLSGKKV